MIKIHWNKQIANIRMSLGDFFQILLLRPDGWYWGNIFEYSTLEIFTQIFHIRTILTFLLQFVKSSDQFGNFGWFWFVLHFCLLNAGYEESSLRIMRWIREFSLWDLSPKVSRKTVTKVISDRCGWKIKHNFSSSEVARQLIWINADGKAEINYLCKYYY